MSVLDERLALPDAQRRQILRLAAQGAAIPAAYALLWVDSNAASTAQPGAVETPPPEATRTGGASAHIARNFDDPCIELVRLLHQAAEIEHALMIQYLYAAFSVKPAYQAIAGFPAPGANDLLGVAIQEMRHLGKVNQLLVALGMAPTLIREDFPYEPGIYPFHFNLEPLSRGSLAKYVWTEAPAGTTDLNKARTDGDKALCLELERVLGASARPNHVGTLYDAVIAGTEELVAAKDADLPDLRPWLAILHDIKAEGEVGHFRLFRRLFLGTHEGFAGRADVWHNASDPEYPSHALPTNPTAYVGHANQITDPQALGLAWLGNLHYWILLTLLSEGYSRGSPERIALARGHMMGPFWSLARRLAVLGSGMPFDPLALGYAPGVSSAANTRLLVRLLGEADRFEQRLGTALPSDFPAGFCRGTKATLAQLTPKRASPKALTQPWDDGLA